MLCSRPELPDLPAGRVSRPPGGARIVAPGFVTPIIREGWRGPVDAQRAPGAFLVELSWCPHSLVQPSVLDEPLVAMLAVGGLLALNPLLRGVESASCVTMPPRKV